MEVSPLILTLALNEEAFVFFTSLRQQYFPPERNFLKAHLTLFHHLPADKMVEETIRSSVTSMQSFPLNVADVVSIGKGVAYKIESPPLQAFHKKLQEVWSSFLTPQDKQKLWPHVTVQNKVSPLVAKETLVHLKDCFQPFMATATGLTLWYYKGGPWEFYKHFPFKQ